MAMLGRFIQVLGLLITGTGCVLGFREETSEGAFILLGFGGFAVFYLGTMLRGRGE